MLQVTPSAGQRRRTYQVLAVLSIIGVAATGCSSITPPAKTSSTKHPSSSSKPHATTPPPHGSQLVSLTTDQGLIANDTKWSVGPRSVAYAVGDDQQPAKNSFTFTTIGVFTDKPLAQQTETITLPGSKDELVDERVAAQTETTAPPGFAVAYTVTSPQGGLQPAETRLHVQTFSATASSPTHSATLDSCPFESCDPDDAALIGDTVVVDVYNSHAQGALAVSATTGKLLWSKPDAAIELAADSLVVLGHASNGNGSYTSDDPITAIDAVTGETKWTLATPSGYQFNGWAKRLGDDYAAFGFHDVNYRDEPINLVTDLTTGAVVATYRGSPDSGIGSSCLQHMSLSYDSVDHWFLALSYVEHDGNNEPQLTATKAGDAAPATTISADQLDQLDCIQPIGLTESTMWVTTSDGIDLIDLPSGKQDPRSPAHNVSKTATPTVGADSVEGDYIPLWTIGDISILGKFTAGIRNGEDPAAILVHQNKPLTVDSVLSAGGE